MLNKLINYDLYFIHIPKNAGTSFEKQLCDRHVGHHSIKDTNSELQHKTIAIIRNPYKRLISFYNYAKLNKSYWHSDDNTTEYPLHELYDYCNKNTFETFIKDLCMTDKFDGFIHLLPQYKWLLTSENKIVTNLIRFEHLNEDLSKLLGNSIELIRINTSNTNNYSNYYSDELKDLVYIKYKKDFDLFGTYDEFSSLD